MTDSHSDNTRRIAKNTLALYVRTFITMCVGLYTGRVMLDALGIDNYGIRNVVGGIIDMSSIITGTMAGAISRYITFALGEGDKERLNRVFSTSVNVQIIMERLGGGGHMNIAGAQLENMTSAEAIDVIKDTINTMLQEGAI